MSKAVITPLCAIESMSHFHSSRQEQPCTSLSPNPVGPHYIPVTLLPIVQIRAMYDLFQDHDTTFWM
jgi:hypothetical protein